MGNENKIEQQPILNADIRIYFKEQPGTHNGSFGPVVRIPGSERLAIINVKEKIAYVFDEVDSIKEINLRPTLNPVQAGEYLRKLDPRDIKMAKKYGKESNTFSFEENFRLIVECDAPSPDNSQFFHVFKSMAGIVREWEKEREKEYNDFCEVEKIRSGYKTLGGLKNITPAEIG